MSDAKLMLHCGAREVTREQLDLVPCPPAEGRWRPVPHGTVLTYATHALADAGYAVFSDPDTFHVFGHPGTKNTAQRRFGLGLFGINGAMQRRHRRLLMPAVRKEMVEASAGKLQVNLLATEPKAEAKRTVLALATDQDRLGIRGRELFWLPSGGQLESELDFKAIDAALGISTRRTKGTMEQVAAKYFAD